MTTYVPEVIEGLSPNHSPRKRGVRVDTVLIHHTASASSLGSLAWMCSPKGGVSAHYLVGTEGEVWRLVPEGRKAWHAGKGRLPWEACAPYDFNHRSIGIEVVNPGDGKTPFTEAQYRALEWLVPDIVKRLNYPRAFCWPGSHATAHDLTAWPTPALRQGGSVFVLGHRHVAPGRKTDPADNFDWARIRAALAGG